MNGFFRASAFLLIYCLCTGFLGLGTCCLGQQAESVLQASKPDWKRLAGPWETCQFGGEGAVKLFGNQITIASGQPLSGVFLNEDHRSVAKDGEIEAKASPLIRDGYELKLQARRTAGFDFFCGLTFPIADKHATLVLGGWGGGITGLSCVDGLDASENDTTLFRDFEDQRWYQVRVRVDSVQVQCWVDDKSVARVSRLNHKFSLRTEMDLCEPLGIAAYQCDAEFKDIMIRKLSEAERKTSPQVKAIR